MHPPITLPAVALVDPGLALSMPPHLTATTGIDAIVHTLEAYLGEPRQPSMDLLALGALEFAVAALPATVGRTARTSAPGRRWRTRPCRAGMAMDRRDWGCVTRYAAHSPRRSPRCITAWATPYLPAVLAFNAPAISAERWPRLRDALGLRGSRNHARGTPVRGAFIGELGLPTRLAEVGVRPDDLPLIAAEATRMAMIGNNVRPAGRSGLPRRAQGGVLNQIQESSL